MLKSSGGAWLPSDSLPMDVALNAAAGAVGMVSRADHVHAARIQRAIAALNASGEVTITFARLFTSKPTVNCLYEEAADNQPIVLKIKGWTQDGSNNYTGVTVKGYRAQTLPSVLTLLTQLLSFNIFGAAAPSGITVHIFAADPTQ